MLLLASSIKLVAEIALMALVGQGLLALLAGDRRHNNFFYRLLQTLTQPVVKTVRAITPKIVLDRHVPYAAFLLLLAVWFFATMAKVNLCLQVGVEHCR